MVRPVAGNLPPDYMKPVRQWQASPTYGGDLKRRSEFDRKCIFCKVTTRKNDFSLAGIACERSLLFPRHAHFLLEHSAACVTLHAIADLTVNLRAIQKYS